MALGMGYAEFWRSTPRIVNIYVKAQREREKRIDAMHWSLGSYFFEAVYVAIGKYFGGDNFDAEYPEKPHSVEVVSPEERQRRREEREIQRMIAEEERQIAILRKMGLPESNTR